jgi:prophage regulatory protein
MIFTTRERLRGLRVAVPVRFGGPGLSRQRAYQIITRKDFPDPYQEQEMGKVWNAVDVERWIKQRRPHPDDEDEA